MSLLLRNRGRLLTSSAVLVAGLLIASCTTSVGSSSAIPTPARTTIPTGSASASGGVATVGDLKRTSQGGNVTLEVTWENDAVANGASLQFKVEMDTHSVDLDGIDMGRSAVLRNDTGIEVSAERWDAPAGGHHRSGTIVFPSTAGSSALITPQTKFIELVVRDVAGVKERSFKWELSS